MGNIPNHSNAAVMRTVPGFHPPYACRHKTPHIIFEALRGDHAHAEYFHISVAL